MKTDQGTTFLLKAQSLLNFFHLSNDLFYQFLIYFPFIKWLYYPLQLLYLFGKISYESIKTYSKQPGMALMSAFKLSLNMDDRKYKISNYSVWGITGALIIFLADIPTLPLIIVAYTYDFISRLKMTLSQLETKFNFILAQIENSIKELDLLLEDIDDIQYPIITELLVKQRYLLLLLKTSYQKRSNTRYLLAGETMTQQRIITEVMQINSKIKSHKLANPHLNARLNHFTSHVNDTLDTHQKIKEIRTTGLIKLSLIFLITLSIALLLNPTTAPAALCLLLLAKVAYWSFNYSKPVRQKVLSVITPEPQVKTVVGKKKRKKLSTKYIRNKLGARKSTPQTGANHCQNKPTLSLLAKRAKVKKQHSPQVGIVTIDSHQAKPCTRLSFS